MPLVIPCFASQALVGLDPTISFDKLIWRLITMPFLVKKTETRSTSPRAVMTFVTIGALLTVWSGAWYFFLQPDGPTQRFLCAGFFLSGMVFLIIGAFMGLRNIPTKVQEEEVDHDAENQDVDLELSNDHVGAHPVHPKPKS